MVPSANSATPTATLPDDEETGSTTAAAPESLDLVIDYSGDLLLYLTDDGKISPAAAQNERIAASVSASAQAAGRDPAPGGHPHHGGRAPPPHMLRTVPRAPPQAPPAPQTPSTCAP